MLWALPLLPLLALGNIRGAALRGLGWVNLGQLPESLLHSAFLLLGIGVVFVIGTGVPVDAADAMKLQCAAALLAFLVGAYWLALHRPTAAERFIPSPEMRRSWLTSSLILGLVAGLQSFNSSADIVMLGWMRDNETVGVFKVAILMSVVASFTLASLNAVIMPRVVTLLQSGQQAALQQIVSRTARISFGAALATLLALFFFGTPLIALLFGEAYSVAYPAMIILVVGHAINAMFGPVSLLLTMAGHERDTLRGLALGATVNVAANLTLVPVYGGVGAAAGTTLSLLTWNAFLFFRARSRLGIVCLPLHPALAIPQ